MVAESKSSVTNVTELTDEQLLALPETKALLIIRNIYSEENKLKDLSATERLSKRKEKIAPFVDNFFDYIRKMGESDDVFSDRLNKAITNAINQEKRLRMFLTDGNISIVNGNANRKIRSYSVGRANWLFADTTFGAEINAMMYSVVETAKANNVNVLIYLRYLLEETPKHLGNERGDYLKDMVPWADKYLTYEKNYRELINNTWQGAFSEPEKPKTQWCSNRLPHSLRIIPGSLYFRDRGV